MPLIRHTHKLYAPSKAEEIAKFLSENDPEWDYRVEHAPNGTGLSFIEIYDEDGESVGKY